MSTLQDPSYAQQVALMLPGFAPLHSLWEDNPVFPSENSARWALKQHRQQLIDAQAVAFHLGRTVVHRERLLAVLAAVAVDSYKQRFAAEAR